MRRNRRIIMANYLTDGELKQLLDTPKALSDSIAQRDYHWMSALVLTGCRIEEFSYITIGDVMSALQTKYLFIPKERRKGRKKDHSIFITEALKKHLKALVMMAEDTDNDAPLIPNKQGGHLCVRAYQKRVIYWAKEAGLPYRVTPHWFRHTRGYQIFKNSGSKRPLQIIQEVLGHQNINTTTIYSRPTRDEVALALQETDKQGSVRKNMTQLRREFNERTSQR